MAKKFTQGEFQEFVVSRFDKAEKFQEYALNEFASLRSELKEFRAKVDLRFERVHEILDPLAKAFDVDAPKLVDHERRIARIEKQFGIGNA